MAARSLLLWLSAVRTSWVKQAPAAYARALLSRCDVLYASLGYAAAHGVPGRQARTGRARRHSLRTPVRPHLAHRGTPASFRLARRSYAACSIRA